MQFFTRELYDRSQTSDESLWADNEAEWDAANTRRNELFNSLRDSLPHAVQEFFADMSLHDSVMQSVSRGGPHQIAMLLDTRGAPWITGTRCTLEFSSVRLGEGIDDLSGHWWLYDEIHSAEPGAFDLRVLCDKSEFRIVAGDLRIECT